MKEQIMELMQPVILAVVTIGVGAILAYIRTKIKDTKTRLIFNEVESCILEGMAQAQEQIVRPAKAKGDKLDIETISNAEAMALKFAKQAAKGEALDQLEKMSSGRLKSTIKQLLAK